MKLVTLGSTGITVPQNAYGCLPIQRIPRDEAIDLLRKAYAGGMRFFDTSRVYGDSESKIGEAFEGMREQVYIATKTTAKTHRNFWKHLEISLQELRTDYIDLYQLHVVPRIYRPGERDGLYDALLEAKAQGKIRHIGITTHKFHVAEEIIESGLYETLQYPISYLSTDREIDLIRRAAEKGMGFIGMKGLAGGLLTNSRAAMAHAAQFDNFVPIWGIQKEKELEEWLSYMEEMPVMNDAIREMIEKDKAELDGEFCRGCGYCMPCPAGIQIDSCARMSLMLRRCDPEEWLTPDWQKHMQNIENCLHCMQCTIKCPYELNTPKLLKKNYEDYKRVLAGEAVL